MRNLILEVDFISPRVCVYHNGFTSYKSILGGILSLLSLFLVLAITMYMSEGFLSQDNPRVSTSYYINKRAEVDLYTFRNCFSVSKKIKIKDINVMSFLTSQTKRDVHFLLYYKNSSILEYFPDLPDYLINQNRDYLCLDFSSKNLYSKETKVDCSSKITTTFAVQNLNDTAYLDFIFFSSEFNTKKPLKDSISNQFQYINHFFSQKINFGNVRNNDLHFSTTEFESFDSLGKKQSISATTLDSFYYFYQEPQRPNLGISYVNIFLSDKSVFVRREYMTYKDLILNFVASSKLINFLVLVFRFIVKDSHLIDIIRKSSNFHPKQPPQNKNLENLQTCVKLPPKKGDYSISDYLLRKFFLIRCTRFCRKRLSNYEESQKQLRKLFDILNLKTLLDLQMSQVNKKVLNFEDSAQEKDYPSEPNVDQKDKIINLLE